MPDLGHLQFLLKNVHELVLSQSYFENEIAAVFRFGNNKVFSSSFNSRPLFLAEIWSIKNGLAFKISSQSDCLEPDDGIKFGP